MNNKNTPYRQNGDPCDRVNASSSIEALRNSLPNVAGMRVHWSDQSKQVTQMAGLAYFVQFLETTRLFDHFVESCPLIVSVTQSTVEVFLTGLHSNPAEL